MSRTLSAALMAHIGSSSTTTCYLTRLTRRDGFQIGFAFTDEAITYNGLLYVPQGSITVTALSSTADNGIDNFDFTGILSSSLVTDLDLRRHLYDGAEIAVYEVNYNNLTMGAMLVARGYVGEVTVNSNGQYIAEFRSLEQFMAVQIGDATSPTCRCRRLGDSQCKVNIAAYTVTGTAAANDPNDPTNVLTNIRPASDLYSGGVLRLSSGNNAGVERDIRLFNAQTGQLYLQEQFPFAVPAGTTMQMEQGCDRRFVTCDTRYSNTINFHGEPYLPGSDSVVGVARPPS